MRATNDPSLWLNGLDVRAFSIHNSFLFNWLDLLAFSLSGLKAEGTSCAAMAYVMADLHREGAKLGKSPAFGSPLGLFFLSFVTVRVSIAGSCGVVFAPKCWKGVGCSPPRLRRTHKSRKRPRQIAKHGAVPTHRCRWILYLSRVMPRDARGDVGR